jgi:hypothetical protein
MHATIGATTLSAPSNPARVRDDIRTMSKLFDAAFFPLPSTMRSNEPSGVVTLRADRFP